MISLIAAALILTPCQTPVPIEDNFASALQVAGLSTKTARFDENLMRFFGGGEFTTAFFQSCFENPWRIPFFADLERHDLATMSGRPSDSLMVGSRLLGFNLRRTLLGNPNKDIEALATNPGELDHVLSQMKASGIIVAEVPSTKKVPPQTQQAAALVLHSMLKVVEYRRMAFASLGDLNNAYNFIEALKPGNNDDIEGATFSRLYQIDKGVDMRYLLAGAHDLALAAQSAEALALKVDPSTKYSFEVKTRWGRICLHGGEDKVYSEDPTLLVIDTGGKDTYINAPSNASASNWASVVIDTSGNDAYLSDTRLQFKKVSSWDSRKNANCRPGPAGALLGYSILIDSEGDDVYRSHLPGLGSGRFGVGLLLDYRGNDTYDAYTDSEGFGNFGVGILEDVAGNDRYDGFLQVQGCGQTMGFGYLADRAGNDIYIANDAQIDFPSAQSADHNTNMAQGAGNGRRADYLESHALSGGIGILSDPAGNNTYSCAVFGQGTGYWNGVGMLWGSPGKDEYVGKWYVQGAAAHFAIGYLEDPGGDDLYSADMNMAQGAGHDFSLGMLLDWGGSDRFFAPNLSLGAGNANGMGVLAKMEGKGTYEMFPHEDASHNVSRAPVSLTLGKAAESPANSLRSRALCLGLFLDLTGHSIYPTDATWAKTGNKTTNWTQHRADPSESSLGIFSSK